MQPGEVVLVAFTLLVAYANGANANFKGVASLFGSGTCTYRTAILWGTLWTFAGALAAISLSRQMLLRFSGRGLVSDEVAGSTDFLLAVALGAGVTVVFATFVGFPISVTHALTGAICGTALALPGEVVRWQALFRGFFLPLALSPVLAVGISIVLYTAVRAVRAHLSLLGEGRAGLAAQIAKSDEPQYRGSQGPSRAVALSTQGGNVRREIVRSERQQVVDTFHFISAGTVSFARGLNDTPKIAALLAVIKCMNVTLDLVAVACLIALGGLVSARKVAETLSMRITSMDHTQGLSANGTTSILVIVASIYGLPVSTTHVSVGSLFGIGLLTRKGNTRLMTQILLSWLITLPCAGAMAGLCILLIRD